MIIWFLKSISIICLQRISITVTMNTNKEVAQFTTIIRKLLIHKNYHNIRIFNRGKYAQMNMVCVLYIRTCSEAWMWWLSLNGNWISPSFKIIIINEILQDIYYKKHSTQDEIKILNGTFYFLYAKYKILRVK